MKSKFTYSFLILGMIISSVQVHAAEFLDVQDLYIGTDPKEITVSDLNGDGSKDIVFVDQGAIKVIYQTPPYSNVESVNFDGTAKLRVDESIDFAADNSTISFWVKMSSLPADGAETVFFVENHSDDISVKNAQIYYRDSQLFFKYGVNVSTMFTLNEWHHVVAINNLATDRVQIIFDGVLIMNRGGAYDYPDIASGITVGASDQNKAYMDGKMDDLLYFNTALSTLATKSLYHNSDVYTHSNFSNIKLWLTMGDEKYDSFEKIVDKSMNNHDATPTNITFSNDIRTEL